MIREAAPRGSPEGARSPSPTVLKDEPLTRITLRPWGRGVGGVGDGTALVKRYRSAPGLAWRTWLLPSRARRECIGLQAIRAAGVGCVAPLGVGELRTWGRVLRCWLATDYRPEARPLHQVVGSVEPEVRGELAVAIGRLMRGLHEAGILWLTCRPRNLLVDGDPAQARLLVCDVPYAAQLRRSAVASREALIDLRDAGFSRAMVSLFDPAQRKAMLVAYCGGNEPQADGLWHTLARRSRSRHRLARRLVALEHCYVRPLLSARGRRARAHHESHGDTA